MVYLIAYCQNNLGDDLFIRTIVRRYPNEKFYLFAHPRYTKVFANEKNLFVPNKLMYYALYLRQKILRRKGRLINFLRFRTAKAVVQIGGSIFIERFSGAKAIRLDKHPHQFLIGCNFGPYKTENFFHYGKSKIAALDDCCFRDLYSFNLFKELPNVRYAPDVLFGMPNLPQPIEGGKCVSISIIDINGRPDLCQFEEKYEQGIVEICNRWIKFGRKIKIMCFCRAEGDFDFAERIKMMVNKDDKVTICTYENDIDCFLDELNMCDIIYATRFHAMVLGWKMKKKVVPIVYSIKQKNVMEDIGYTGTRWNILDGENFTESLVTDIPECIDDETIDQLSEKSQLQFWGFENFLSSWRKSNDQ